MVSRILSRNQETKTKKLNDWISTDVLPKLKEVDVEEEEEEEGQEDVEEEEICTSQQPLVLNNIEIISRKIDGFINLTAVCQAGKKDFKEWNRNKKTKTFLQVLSSSVEIPTDNLIKYETGSNENRATWGHRLVAIEIARWISPDFGFKVSKWVDEDKQVKNILSDFTEKNHQELSKYQIQPNVTEDTTFKLKLLNNEVLDIAIRKDGYVNATQLCKAGNKLFGHYQTSKQTQDYLQALSFNIGIPITDLLDIKQGGINQGTYVHRKVAYHLAQWISPHFAVQVSNILDELLLTGKVELGKEKNNEELENIYKDKLLVMENQLVNTKEELKVLTHTHNSMLKRQKRTAYEVGNVIYIVSHEAFTNNYGTEYFKIGKATQTKDETISAFTNRLSTYNTCAPINYDVDYLIYVEENTIIENSIKARFRKELNPSNKEWIKGVKLHDITDFIKSLCDLINVDYKIVVCKPKEEEENEEVVNEDNTPYYQCKCCKEYNVKEKRAEKCVQCSRIDSRKVVRPSYEQLIEDTNNMSIASTGKKYGVSDNTIRKWIKSYKKDF